MQKILSLIIIGLLVSACDGFGSKKTKTIMELTTKLVANSTESVKFNTQSDKHTSTLDQSTFKKNSYNLTKNNLISTPIFAKGKIFSIDDNGLVAAFSIKEKKKLWHYNISENAYDPNYAGGGIIYNNEKLYITNGSRYLVILDATNGYEILRKEFPDIIRTNPVIIAEDKILVQTISNQIFVYDIPAVKVTLWHETLPGSIASSYHVSPVIYNNKAIISYNSGLLVALNPHTGQTEWEVNLAELNSDREEIRIITSPLIYMDDLYIADSSGTIYKININNGSIIWQNRTSDIQSMSIIGNNLFITTNGRQLAAISLTTGAIKWVTDLSGGQKNQAKPEMFLPPFIMKSLNGQEILVVAGNNNILYSFDYHNDTLSPTPDITKIPAKIIYTGTSCCSGGRYLISNKQVIFLN